MARYLRCTGQYKRTRAGAPRATLGAPTLYTFGLGWSVLGMQISLLVVWAVERNLRVV